MRYTPLHSVQHARGMGFLPALIAALPAIAGAAGSVMGAKAGAKADEDALKAQIEIAKQNRLANETAARQRAKWMPWAIGGGVVAVGLIAWALMRRRRP